MEVKPELQAVAGSPLWQAVFISFAVVLILFEVVRGWRLGLVRQLVRIAALVVAYAAAIFGGRLLVPIVRPFLKMPDIVLSFLAGAVLAPWRTRKSAARQDLRKLASLRPCMLGTCDNAFSRTQMPRRRR